jgi:GT2 family glycosyltransferase
MDMTVADMTVAIPCYNGAAYLGQTIESILEQTHPAQQIVVVDDGSTDNSADIVSRYPVQLVQHSQNKGLAAARNTAVAAATGDILVFVDVDAIAAADLLAVLLSGYDTPEIGGVGGQGIEANVHSLADRWRRAHATQGHGPAPKLVDHLYGLCMSYRLSVLKQVGGFNPDFRTNAEDVDFGLRVNQAGYRLRYLPQARVYHQRTDDEISLKRAMVAWYAAGYRAKRLNQAQSWRLFAGTLRRLVTDPLSDILFERDIRLARLSCQMGWIKLRALQRSLAQSRT